MSKDEGTVQQQGEYYINNLKLGENKEGKDEEYFFSMKLLSSVLSRSFQLHVRR